MIHLSGPPLAGGTGNDWSCLAGSGGRGTLSAPPPSPELLRVMNFYCRQKMLTLAPYSHVPLHLCMEWKREEHKDDWSVF